MTWPLGTHFSSMLQNPSMAFRDDGLKKCQIETSGTTNQPKPRSGSFAVVFKATLADSTERAIRPFTSEVPERRERYDLISRALRNKSLSCMVEFDYSDNGIRSTDGKWYPLVTMEWVRGEILFSWLHNACHREDKKALSEVAEKWVALVNELRTANISHGDLQHANVMVDTAGQLKLVDYDCMYVPEMGSQRKNLEVGVEPYQHPGRDGNTLLSPDLDNFSALFILVALKALAADPGLWKRYVCKSNQIQNCEYEKLLIRREDFENPAGSGLYREFRGSTDPDVGRLAESLFGAFNEPITDVPSMSVLLVSSEQLVEALDQGDFDRVVELIDLRGDDADLPPDLVARIEKARRSVKCRKELERVVLDENEQLIAKIYDPGLLDEYPAAAKAVAIARDAGQFVRIYNQLDEELKKKDWLKAETIWQQYRGLLRKRPSSKKYVEQLKTVCGANQAYRVVLKARDNLLRDDSRDTGKLVKAWGRLESLGGHPQLNAERPQIEQLISQGKHWKQFRELPVAAGQANDQRRYDFWHKHKAVFVDWPPAEKSVSDIEKVQKRLAMLRDLRSKVEHSERQILLPSEQEILVSAEKLSASYAHDLADRVVLARDRVAAFKKLQADLVEDSETAICAAWQDLAAVGGSTMVTVPADRERVEFSVKCHPRLERLRELERSRGRLQLDEFEKQLLDIFTNVEPLLEKCRDARSWLPIHKTAVDRRAILHELDQAVRRDDEWRVVELAEKPLLENYPFSQKLREAVETSRDAVKRARDMLEALSAEDTKRFLKEFDAGTVRKFSGRFEPFSKRIRELVQSEIADPKRIGLKRPFFRSQWRPGVNGTCNVRWVWPERRFAHQCVLAVCPQEPKGPGEPKDHRPHFMIEIELQNFQASRGLQPIHVRDKWPASWLGVWAIVELGNGEKIYSEPLVLGPLTT